MFVLVKRYCDTMCPYFQAAMDVLSRPWNGVIIEALADGPLRFGELQERVAAIGDRILSQRLKELVEHGVIERRVLAGPPVGVEYATTDVGRAFRPVANSIRTWGERLAKPRSAPAKSRRR